MVDLCEKCGHRTVCRFREHYTECLQFIKEVVRCKDCKHWDEYHMGSLDGPGTGMGVCLEGCNWVDGKRADDFCSYGERKDK